MVHSMELLAAAHTMTNAQPEIASPREMVALHGARLAMARGLWLTIAGLALVIFVLLAPANFRDVAGDWQVQKSYPAISGLLSLSDYALYVLGVRYLAALIFFATAALIYWRKSNDWFALLVSLTLVLVPIGSNLGGYSEYWHLAFPSPWNSLLSFARDVLALLSMACFLLLFFLFPDGRFVPHWARWIALCSLIAVGIFIVLSWLPPPANGESWWLFFSLTFAGSLVAGALSQVYRYRRVSGPVQRRQSKWIVFVLTLYPLLGLLNIMLSIAGEERYLSVPAVAMLSLHLQLIVGAMIPLALAVSVLHNRLWDADVVINRTLVYSALTMIVIVLYVLIVGLLGTLLQTSDNLVMAIIATGLVAMLFHPVRARLQRGINHMMYGQRDEPVEVLTRLGQRLEMALAPDLALRAIIETVAQTLKLPYAAITLKDGAAFRTVAAYGSAGLAQAELVLPLRYQSEVIAQLIVTPRAPGETFTRADRCLLENIARQAGAAAQAVRLSADLQRSRERLVTTREEERRRLRRDLHDELGPTLASQALKLDAALELMTEDPAAANALLLDVKKQTQAIVGDIRRLVYELRPPALDELGLVSALRARFGQYGTAVNGLRISVDAPQAMPPLSAAVEVAAYRIALEAVTNVVRHAQAHECIVRLELLAGERPALQIEIRDDGHGLPAGVRSGVGWSSMRERATELGGLCDIAPAPAGGVSVIARLPILTNSTPQA